MIADRFRSVPARRAPDLRCRTVERFARDDLGDLLADGTGLDANC